MKEFNDSKGIRHEKSPPYTPEANGRAEREVRTLVECARTMLIDSGLDEEMWAEAIVCAAYLLNRTTNKHQRSKTPFEAWYNKKPEIKHLRIFGSTAFVQVPKVNRSKLEPKSAKTVMVGYDGESKVYRLWDAARHEIVIANNVHICDGIMLQGTRELLQNDFWVTPSTIMECPTNDSDEDDEDLYDSAQEEDFNERRRGDEECNERGVTIPDQRVTRKTGLLEPIALDEKGRSTLVEYGHQGQIILPKKIKGKSRQEESGHANSATLITRNAYANTPISFEEAVASEDSTKWRPSNG
ncbi:Copia protein [Cyphomyrmex costatus]|uniref:Copia protein n=1 Tax=Cyphomyrmex costatus TaxID=456900 RepID=A0A151K1V0_9HYME|nr:Copia protein [Cyphomyrmex costatus]